MSSGPSNALLTSSSLYLLSSVSNRRVYGLSIDNGALSSLDDVLVGSLGSTGLGGVVGCGLGKLVLNGCLRLFEHVSGGGRGGFGEVGLCDGEPGDDQFSETIGSKGKVTLVWTHEWTWWMSLLVENSSERAVT